MSCFLNFFRLNQVGLHGYGNIYYAAAVKSMLHSWHNFFYVAFDPTGILAVDKPPVGLWLQATSARVFGFHGLSLLLPQALAGVAAVLLLYHLVQRDFGRWAGVIAAFVLAVTPISVVTNRNNTQDSLLVFVLLLAAWTTLRAKEGGHLGWLLVTAVFVGIGFNIKMLQALLVVPAFGIVYLVAAPVSWQRRVLQLALATVVLLIVWLAWVIMVEATPVQARPYIGGSQTNSVWDLIIWYNGIARFRGEDWTSYIGTPSLIRLVNKQLEGQISWFLPFVIAALIPVAFRAYRKRAFTYQNQATTLWGLWALPQIIFFSVSTFFHTYYLALLAPAFAALTAIGGVTIWRVWQQHPQYRWLLPSLIVGTALVQSGFILPFPLWSRWLVPLLIGLALLTSSAVVVTGRRTDEQAGQRIRYLALTGTAGLCIGPLLWATIPVITCVDAGLPQAGPQNIPCRENATQLLLDPTLLAYLHDHRHNAVYLGVTYDLGIAALGILATNDSFVALGGYRGTDPVFTHQQIIDLLTTGQVQTFIRIKHVQPLPDQQPVITWIREHCEVVPLAVEDVEVFSFCQPRQRAA